LQDGGYLMFKVEIATVLFSQKLKEYQRLTKKALADVLREQAALLAQRLVKLTFPASASQGKRRVEIDINRVYMRPAWFEDVFSFRKQKLGDRIKALIRGRDTAALEKVFDNSPKLRLVHIESFDPARHARLRRRGRVLVHNPFSFPLSDQSKVKALIAEKKRAVGTSKAGWASCAAQLGKSQPSWLNKDGTGSVTDASRETSDPHIVLTNKVPWFADLDSRANIVARALEGRAVNMQKSAENQLRLAAKAAGL
jgi:hypothetical protein